MSSTKENNNSTTEHDWLAEDNSRPRDRPRQRASWFPGRHSGLLEMRNRDAIAMDSLIGVRPAVLGHRHASPRSHRRSIGTVWGPADTRQGLVEYLDGRRWWPGVRWGGQPGEQRHDGKQQWPATDHPDGESGCHGRGQADFNRTTATVVRTTVGRLRVVDRHHHAAAVLDLEITTQRPHRPRMRRWNRLWLRRLYNYSRPLH
jgi:hypothetical protein